MVIQHDKHIDSLASSIGSLASNVQDTNNKLGDVIDVLAQQNVLVERINNLDSNVAESFKRAWGRLGKLEDESANGGCDAAKALHKEKASITEKIDASNCRIKDLEVDVKDISSDVVGSSTIRWALGLLIFYSITFGVYVVTSQHDTETAFASYVASTTESRKSTDEKLRDISGILRDEDRTFMYSVPPSLKKD